ncbi:hypothetical protein HPB48_018319 [Haemaphysalis longicornis]|uniref:Uncharacterized protein n=1 Tax=Haemaphysalis longicornis TaxID=44386 RepID=A0A9J6GW60_HAELO|nr:hypothetical protein HPB48_018319 [Haemaphysalis longicornis]
MMLQDVSAELTTITSRCEDAENRLRRSNLLFFGLEDDPKEDWTAPEKNGVKLCSDKLEIQINSSQFERVNRLGKYQEGEIRFVIAKLTFFKDKQSNASCHLHTS